jgi:tRNA 5-methylaminomethyl-2-thiouridine biosynthesis bifunctional protein
MPRSGRFGDVYFSSDDGLAETRAVFLTGCGLPEAWARTTTASRSANWASAPASTSPPCWISGAAAGPPAGRLNIFSIEAFPGIARRRRPRAGPLARAGAGRRPEAGAVAAPVGGLSIASTCPNSMRRHRSGGDGRRERPRPAWTGRADAWFLDGFAPATNPGDVAPAGSGPARRPQARPGARAATFTVAGVVRRGLHAAGFTVGEAPRPRAQARAAGSPLRRARRRSSRPTAHRRHPRRRHRRRQSLARAFRAGRASSPCSSTRRGPGAGASGNPAAPGLAAPRRRPRPVGAPSMPRPSPMPSTSIAPCPPEPIIAHGTPCSWKADAPGQPRGSTPWPPRTCSRREPWRAWTAFARRRPPRRTRAGRLWRCRDADRARPGGGCWRPGPDRRGSG